MKNSILRRNNFSKVFYFISSIIVLIVIWHFLALGVAKDLLIPTPKATFIKIINIVRHKDFAMIVFGTLGRTTISFLISFAFALLIGFLSALNIYINRLIDPIVMIIRSIPTISIILVLLLMFNGQKASVLIGFLIVFPMLYSNVVEGIKSVDNRLLEMARCYKVTTTNIVLNIYIPSIKNYLTAGINAAIGLSFKVMISAEVIGEVKNSIGKSLFLQKAYLRMDGVFAWTIILVLMVGLIDRSVDLLIKR